MELPDNIFYGDGYEFDDYVEDREMMDQYDELTDHTDDNDYSARSGGSTDIYTKFIKYSNGMVLAYTYTTSPKDNYMATSNSLIICLHR